MRATSAEPTDDPLTWVPDPAAREDAAEPVEVPGGAATSAGQRRGRHGHSVSWVNAHGGAGASTLTRALGGVDVGRRWPDPARGDPTRMLLVARTHAAGMQAASRALDSLRRQQRLPELELLALVLVADAPGRLPLPLARRVRIIRSVVPVRRIPWIPAWRLGEEPERPPKEVLRLAGLIEAQSRRNKEAR